MDISPTPPATRESLHDQSLVQELRGLVQVSKESELKKNVFHVIQTHPVEVKKYLAGKENVS